MHQWWKTTSLTVFVLVHQLKNPVADILHLLPGAWIVRCLDLVDDLKGPHCQFPCVHYTCVSCKNLFIPVGLTLTMCLTSCLSRQPFPSRSYTLNDHFSLSVSLPRRTRFTAATNSMKSIWPSCWEETGRCQSSMLNACPCTAKDLILNWWRTCSRPPSGPWSAVHRHAKWKNHKPGRSRTFSLSYHLVSIEGAEHILHVGVLLFGRVAADAKYLLEFMKMQLPARTLACKLPVELLDVLQGHLLLRATLRLAHSHRHVNPR